MTQSPQLSQRLTSMDASFLYFEKKEAPLHIGSTHVFEGEIPFEAFVENVRSKMPLLPRYRQKVVPAPFNVGHPTWEFDPNFDIRNHIIRVEVEAPGTEVELNKLASQLFKGMLDRNKPLWEIFLVYGLEGGNSAFVARIHHAMIDGISGIDLLKIMLDMSPEVPPPPKMELEEVTPRPPDPTRRFVDSMLSSTEEVMKSWMDFQSGLVNLTQAFFKEPPRQTLQRTSTILPTISTPPPIFSFNRPPSGEQKLIWNEFFFSEARAIRAAIGGTVNDVVLTALSGAVTRYVESHGQPIAGRSLRVMVPVSMRKEDQRGALGNLVSVLPVEIPMDLKDPLQRYQHLTAKTGTLKSARLAESINLMTALMGTVPPSMQAFVGSIANTVVPAFNIVSTNVPGPQIPLYAMGKRMIAYHPYVPVAYGVGISCAIVSYDQKLYFGITADGKAAPDADKLRDFLDQSWAELRQAAGVAETTVKAVETANIASSGRKKTSKK